MPRDHGGMRAITDRLEWLEHYIRNSEPTKVDKAIREIAWTTIQEIRAIAETLPERGSYPGCICPPTSEKTCQAPLCARRGLLPEVRRPEAIIRLADR